MSEQTHSNPIAAIAVNQIRETSRAKREAAVWRELALQVVKLFASADVADEITTLNADEREFLLHGLVDHRLGDRELVRVALSMLGATRTRKARA